MLRITHNDFIFYDEGMYLTYNQALLDKIQQFPPKYFAEFGAIIKILFYSALTTAKWLWFFISNLRVFAGGAEAFYFTRIVSAVCGVLTIFLTYLFARRYFKSQEIALLSAAVLAILPSHVFYSRLAMQEGLSALCLLAGFYLYFIGRDFGWRAILAAVFFSAVFFTNYRMIVLPVLLIAGEVVAALAQKRSVDWVKAGGTLLMFIGIIFWIGSLNNGSNRFITFAWMTHQAADAPQQWHWINLLSYPFDFFLLEGLMFGLAFFANAYFVIRQGWSKILPFILVLVQMLMFSFAAEKGARYLCVVLPFAAMAVAVAFHEFVLKNESMRKLRWTPILLLTVLIFTLGETSWAIVRSRSGYESAVRYIREKSPNAKILTTQPLVLSLFADSESVKAAPKTVRDLIILYSQGYRYLVIDPQAYVSWTASGARFTPELVDYLGFIRDHMKAFYVTDHLDEIMLRRFVLDHNENLLNSVRFLNERKKDLGAIYVYDLQECLTVMQQIAQSQK